MEAKSAFLVKMEELVRQVVGYYAIPCYRIDSVLDTRLSANGEKTDAPVINIVGFFEDTVSKLTPALHTEFDLSIVKEDKVESNEMFVSAAQVYLAKLKPNRLELLEYRAFSAQQVEIRVASILQDVYTTMQKELSKGKASIPSNVIRDFNRVGALLETADIEFVKIRNIVNSTPNGAANLTHNGASIVPEVSKAQPVVNVVNGAAHTEQPVAPPPVTKQIKEITNESDKQIIEAIDMNVDSFNLLGVSTESNNVATDDSYLNLITPTIPAEKATASIETFNMSEGGAINEDNMDNSFSVLDDSSQLNEATLKDFVQNSSVVKEVDRMIADRAGAKINGEVDIEGDVERLRFLKVFTLKQLRERITENKDDIVAFAEKWIGKDNGGSFDSGICLFYLEYLLVGKKNDPAFAVEYVLKFISDNDYSARYIIPTYNSIRQTNEPPSLAHLTLK